MHQINSIIEILIFFLVELFLQIIDRNRIKVINTSFGLVPCMKAKTVIYGAYFALKLWLYRAYTKYIRKDKHKVSAT